MRRPPGYQWQPLGLDADPVPGEPQAISQEARHLATVASTIAGQIAAMRKIASDNTETGQHAEKIRSTALSLAGSLQAVATRYAKVSSALSGWVPELEQAQALSIRALNEAEAPHARLTQAVTLPSGPNLTATQKQEIAGYHASMQRAQDQLDAAKALLTRATALRDTQGAYYAAKINQASDDSLTDPESLWGDITHAVASYAWLIKDACTVLEVAATVLAVIALFATGVGWLLAVAFILTAVALLGRTLLAAAGQGSWADVAVDTVALLSLGVAGGISGVGGLVGRAGRTLDETIGVGDQLVTAQRASSFSGRGASFFSKFADSINESKVIPDALAMPFSAVARNLTDFNATLRPLASTMVKDVEETSAWARIFAGGEQPAKYAVQMRMLLGRFPGDSEIASLGEKFTGQLRVVRAVVGTGVATTSIPGAVNGVLPISGPDGQEWSLFPHAPVWDRLERDTTAAIPASFVADTALFAQAGSTVW